MGKYDKFALLNPEELALVQRQVEAYLQKKNWKYDVVRDGFYRLYIQSKHDFTVSVQVNDRYMFAVSILPFPVPYSKGKSVIRFINLINSELLCGHFSLDLMTGKIRFKYAVNYVSEEISDKFLGNLINRTAANTIMCLNAFDCVVNQKISPFTALKLVEWVE